MSAVGKQTDQTRQSLSAREKEERVRYSLSTHRYGVHCNRPGPARPMPRVRQQVAIEEVDFEADAEGFQWEVVKSECAVGDCFPHSRLRFGLSKFVFNNAIFTAIRFILNYVNCTIYVLFGFTQNKYAIGLRIFGKSCNSSTVTSYSSPDRQEHE